MFFFGGGRGDERWKLTRNVGGIDWNDDEKIGVRPPGFHRVKSVYLSFSVYFPTDSFEDERKKKDENQGGIEWNEREREGERVVKLSI